MDGPLEAEDITNGASYVLNISSPGLDRPIITNKDYERNLGEELELTFKPGISKKKKIVGTLESYDDESATFNIKGARQTIKREDIKTLKPHISFKKIN